MTFWQGVILGMFTIYIIMRLFDEDSREYEKEIFQKGYEEGWEDANKERNYYIRLD